MFGMTQDQFMGQLRQLIPQVGAILTTLGFTSAAAQLNSYTTVILLVAGPLFQLAGFLWSLKADSKSSIIASATAMPEVDSKKLAAAIADPTLKAVAVDNGTSPPKDDPTKSSNK